MPGLFSLSSAGVLAIAGVAGGIALGHGAVRSINPFFYSEAMPVQAFVPNRSYGMQINAPAQGTPVSAEEARYAIWDPCVGCRTYPEEVQPDRTDLDGHAASLGTEYGYRDATVTDLPPPARASDPERARLARYASYPVSAVEAKAEAPANQAEQEIEAREADESLRAAEDSAVPRGPDPLIY